MIIVVTTDLFFSAKIGEIFKRHGKDVTAARNLSSFQVLLERPPAEIELIVFDLNAKNIDAFRAIEIAGDKYRTLGYYSHVDKELKERALTLGVKDVVPRSKLEAQLATIILKDLAIKT